jgi:hypothetical protein
MLKTCFVALLAIAMSVGVAQARYVHGYHHVHGYYHVIPACAAGRPTAYVCNCSSGKPAVLCHPGEWCRPSHIMGVEGPECRF